MSMSDIVMKQYIVEVVKPFIEKELPQLKAQLKALQVALEKHEEAVGEIEEKVDKQVTLAAKAVKSASAKLDKEDKRKKGAK